VQGRMEGSALEKVKIALFCGETVPFSTFNSLAFVLILIDLQAPKPQNFPLSPRRSHVLILLSWGAHAKIRVSEFVTMRDF